MQKGLPVAVTTQLIINKSGKNHIILRAKVTIGSFNNLFCGQKIGVKPDPDSAAGLVNKKSGGTSVSFYKGM